MNRYNLSKTALQTIQKNLLPNSVILELGSGEGTKALVDMGYQVYSIEAHEEWLGKYGSIYVHAPLKEYEFGTWFDVDKISPVVQMLEYDLLIIDGPRGSEGRVNFVYFSDLFEPASYLIDDTERRGEYAIYKHLEQKLQKKGREYTENGKSFIWL